MATINAIPSVFYTPTEALPEINPAVDYETYLENQARFATERVAETQTPEAEMTDEDWLNDPETVESLNKWCDSLDTPEALVEKDAWVTEQERIANEAALCEKYDADVAELESLGCGARTYIAGHDAKWQVGGDA